MTKEDDPSAPLTREALYALVWSEPMLKVAARYNVSSSYMARVCTLLNVPRPGRGYWAMLAAGKTQPIPPLSDAQPGVHLVWSRDGQDVETARLLPRPPSKTPRRKSQPKTEHPSQHPLVGGAKDLFEAGRLSYRTDYLKPAKKLLIDLAVSKTGLDKALTFANQLFSRLEEYGHRVCLAPSGERFHRAAVDVHETPRKNRGYDDDDLWHPWRCTVVYVGTVAIGLTIIEISEEVEVRYVNGKYIREKNYIPPKRSRYGYEHTWTTNKDFPTGRLCLQAYSPYPRAHWVKRWQETGKHDLATQIKMIVKELGQVAADIARLIEEGERQAELERQEWEADLERWRREEEERQAAQALKESREELLQIIDRWGRANRIEQFFRDAEQRTAGLSDDQRLRLLERLRLAREMVGSVDALDRFLAWKAPHER